MRIRGLLLFVFVVLGAFSPVTATRSAASAGPASPASPKQATLQLADGAVLAVDPAAKTFTLHGKHGDTDFVWDDATTVVGRKSPAYLRVGSAVTVQYTAAGSAKRAVKIAVRPAKHGAEQG